jgi:hypothetical protein
MSYGTEGLDGGECENPTHDVSVPGSTSSPPRSSGTSNQVLDDPVHAKWIFPNQVGHYRSQLTTQELAKHAQRLHSLQDETSGVASGQCGLSRCLLHLLPRLWYLYHGRRCRAAGWTGMRTRFRRCVHLLVDIGPKHMPSV